MDFIHDEERTISQANAKSVLKKIITGTFVIMFIGVRAFICLVVLMALI